MDEQVKRGPGRPKKQPLDVDTATAVTLVEEEMRIQRRQEAEIISVHELGLITGRAQAFGAMKLLSEYLEWKQVAGIIDREEYMKIPGVATVEEYLEKLGLARSTAFRNLKIARTLTPDEVSMLGQVGFTRRDLLSYASLPEEKRLEIREGKVINIESASKEEIKDLIEQVVIEKQQALAEKDEAGKTLQAKDRVLEDKEKLIQTKERELGELRDRLAGRAAEAEMSEEELIFLEAMENLKTSFDGYQLRAQKALRDLQDCMVRTPRMEAAMVALSDYMKIQAVALYDTAFSEFGYVDDGEIEKAREWMQS